jgi:hypothetical protein
MRIIREVLTDNRRSTERFMLLKLGPAGYTKAGEGIREVERSGLRVSVGTVYFCAAYLSSAIVALQGVLLLLLDNGKKQLQVGSDQKP